MLAQIEKGKSNPTVSTIWKIANGLQVSFSLFMKENQKLPIEKVQIDQLDPLIDNDRHYLVYSLFPFHLEKKFEIFTVHLELGHCHFSNNHLGEEYILVQQGKLTLEIQGNEYELTMNEAINF